MQTSQYLWVRERDRGRAKEREDGEERTEGGENWFTESYNCWELLVFSRYNQRQLVTGGDKGAEGNNNKTSECVEHTFQNFEEVPA